MNIFTKYKREVELLNKSKEEDLNKSSSLEISVEDCSNDPSEAHGTVYEPLTNDGRSCILDSFTRCRSGRGVR